MRLTAGRGRPPRAANPELSFAIGLPERNYVGLDPIRWIDRLIEVNAGTSNRHVMIRCTTNELAVEIRKAIRDIPVSGGGVMELYLTTLRDKLSSELLDEIARVAAEVATRLS